MSLQKFLSNLDNVKKLSGGKWKYSARCPCPQHEDNKNSLLISESEEGVFFKCYANCSEEEILKSMGRGLNYRHKKFKKYKPNDDEWDNPQNYFRDDEKATRIDTSVSKPKAMIRQISKAKVLTNSEATITTKLKAKHEPIKKMKEEKPDVYSTKRIESYDYEDAEGHVIIRVDRVHEYDKDNNRIGKAFYPNHNKNGQWVSGLGDVQAVPYRLPELIAGIKRNDPVFIVEGEKDVNNLRIIEYPVTTFLSGLTWKNYYKSYFENCVVYLLPDNDDPGRKKMQKIAEELYGTALFIKIITLPGLEHKGDITDWLENGGDYPTLDKIISETEYFSPEPEIDLKSEDFIQKMQEINYDKIPKGKDDYKEVLNQNTCCEQIKKHYNIVSTRVGRNLIFYMYIDGYWKKTEWEVIEGLFLKWIKPMDRTAYRVEQIRKLLGKMDDVFVSSEIFNSRNDLVNLNNCTYDLVNFKPIPHSRSHYFTLKTQYDYLPGATCHNFDKALDQYSAGQSDWIQSFWEIAGYVQTGSYEHQKMFWFVGKSGANGKGTVIRVMHKLVGDEFVFSQLRTKQLGERFYRKNFIGKRFAYTADLDRFMANIAIIKQLTGGDMQMSDVKFGDSIQFKNDAKIVITMNDLPIFSEGENLSPLKRRIILMSFDYQMKSTDIDPNIEQKFIAEMPGIFLKSMDGLKTLRKNEKFSGTLKGNKLLENFLNHSRMIDEFCNDNYCYDEKLANQPN